jgi:hypothetical protein
MKLKPLLRSIKWAWYPWQAHCRAALPWGHVRGSMTFILGCGRSGTTILGQLLGRHRQVVYLNEPLHYWYVIDRRSDNLDFFGGKGQSWFDASDATVAAARRLDRLFGQVQLRATGRQLVEKLPIHALRMEWLDRLAPAARFVNIVRDGRAVVQSIQVIHRRGQYRIAGKPFLHQWWGVGYHKWAQLAREGAARGFYADALEEIGGEAARDPFAMGTYEWLVSLRQIRMSVEKLRLGPDRYREITYERLLAAPEAALRELEGMLGLEHDPAMLADARTLLRPRRVERYAYALPPRMYAAFAAMQTELGYPTEGVTMLGETPAPSRVAMR